jgi:SAM-dependent methyltransferase
MKNAYSHFMQNCKAVWFLPQYRSKSSAHQFYKPFTIISDYLKPDGKVLDWGCGNCHLSFFLLHNQQKTTAYGFGETSAPKEIADNPLFEFVAADTKEAVKLPFEDCSFDIAVSMGVLEHVHDTGGDQLASLKEINRILRHDGFFLCVHLPYSTGWVESMLGAIMSFKKINRYVHTKRFSKNDVVRLCNDSKLILNVWGRYNFLPRNIMGALRPITNNALFAALFNTIDAFLSFAFPWLCNHSYFVAQKKSPP